MAVILLVSCTDGVPKVPSVGSGVAHSQAGSSSTRPGPMTVSSGSVPKAPRSSPVPSSPPRPALPRSVALPGMPGVVNPRNVYADAGAGMIPAREKAYPAYAYVPHNRSGDVWVIDQRSHKVIRRCAVGIEIQHVVPSYNMTELYATDDVGNRIRVIDPRNGRCGRTIPVIDPYNMYFTPDGRYAIVVAEGPSGAGLV